MKTFNFSMPKFIQLWNPTDKKIELKYDGQTIVLEPDQMIDVTEQAANDCYRDYSHLGIVVIRDGDDPKSKKRESYLAIYECLFRQLKNWNSFKDDVKNGGRTIIGEYRRVTQIKREMVSIEELLDLEPRLDAEFYEALEKEKEIKEMPHNIDGIRRGRPRKNQDVHTSTT